VTLPQVDLKLTFT